MISLKAQIILNREKRRTGETNSDIIERAILRLIDGKARVRSEG